MDGIYLNGRRPKSKAEIRRWLDDPTNDPNRVRIESTSIIGGFDGGLDDALRGKDYPFVGPCPFTNRKFYGVISWSDNRNRWIVA